METSSKKRIIILSATGILLTGLICLFISRNIILCHIVDKRTTRIEQAYGLQIHYQKLQMEGCNKVVLQGLSIIPNQRDTLLTLQSVNVKLSFWKLLKGEVEVRNVHMDGLAINFIKYDSLANYDFLFLKRQQETESKPAIESNYANRIDRVLNLIYGFLPENGQLNQIKIAERKDSNFVAVNIPSFVVEVGQVISVREKSRDMEHFKALREGTTHVVPKWLTFEAEQLQGTVNALPQREDVDMSFEEHLIVELYNK